MQHLSVRICSSFEDAVAQGFVYASPEFTKLELKQAVVVRGGTVEGNSTVDMICEDENGKKYVFMVTRNLIQSIPG
jgi:hypothetical protein